MTPEFTSSAHQQHSVPPIYVDSDNELDGLLTNPDTEDMADSTIIGAGPADTQGGSQQHAGEKRSNDDEDSICPSCKNKKQKPSETSDGHVTLLVGQSQTVVVASRDKLAKHSKYFEKLLQGGFQEGSSRICKLPKDTVPAVNLFVTWVYQREYPEIDNADSHHAQHVMDLYLMADRILCTELEQTLLRDLHKNLKSLLGAAGRGKSQPAASIRGWLNGRTLEIAAKLPEVKPVRLILMTFLALVPGNTTLWDDMGVDIYRWPTVVHAAAHKAKYDAVPLKRNQLFPDLDDFLNAAKTK